MNEQRENLRETNYKRALNANSRDKVYNGYSNVTADENWPHRVTACARTGRRALLTWACPRVGPWRGQQGYPAIPTLSWHPALLAPSLLPKPSGISSCVLSPRGAGTASRATLAA